MLAKDRFNRSDDLIWCKLESCLTKRSIKIGLADRTKRDIIGCPAKHVRCDLGEILTCLDPVKGRLCHCDIVKNHLPDFPCFRRGEFIKTCLIGGGNIGVANLHLSGKHCR